MLPSAIQGLASASVLCSKDGGRARILHQLVQRVLPPELRDPPRDWHCGCHPNDSLEHATVGISGPTLGGASDAGNEQTPFRCRDPAEKYGAEQNATASQNCKNAARNAFAQLRHNWLFVGFIYVCIVCSCILLISAPPAPDVPGQHGVFSPAILEKGDFVFTIVFTVEMFVSIAAQARHTHAFSFAFE